jgi:GWxTD domain-containing protein
MRKIKLKKTFWFWTGVFLLGCLVLAGCSSLPRPKLDPESREFYELARLIMSREEDKIFRLLPDAESRKEFIQEFWEKRDPFPETPENEFKQEFMSRVIYADQRFREGGKGRDTDRGRIYIYLGPPDKFDEVFTHYDSSVRGSIITWIYYNYGVGIEFVDERGTGQYKIRDISGNLFEAMDLIKLGGRFGPDNVFKDRIVRFELEYLENEKQIKIILPVKSLNFSEDEEGNYFVDLQFVFYVYGRDGKKLGKYVEDRIFKVSLREFTELKEAPFYFDLELPGGQGIVDVTISGRGEKGGRIRRLFEIK